jgi:site-specific recombinase XerD
MLQEIEQFIDWVRMRSPVAKTWRDYRCDLELFQMSIGDQNLCEIRPRDVDRFVNHQIERSFKPSTINRRLAAVVSFYRYLIKEGKASACPVLPKRHYIRQPQRLPRPVDRQDLQKFFGTVRDDRDLAMFTLMLRCGLRIGEVAALKMTDLYLGEQPSRLIVHGKGSQERTVYLSQQAERILQGWLAQRPASVRDQHVFLSYRHKKLSTTSISKRIRLVCKAGGVDLTAHRLRHTFADGLLSAGTPITSIQKLMGHRFVETTQNYAVANDKQVQADFYKACEKLDGWKLLLENAEAFDTGIAGGLETSVSVDENNQPQTAIPARISQLPPELAHQLEAYRLLKASRWRVERVAANSVGFYSLHGRMWEFFCEQCALKSASELRLEHVLQFIKARLQAGRSPRTVNGSLSCLRSFLGFLAEDLVAIHHSLDHIERLKEPGRLPRYMTSEQVIRLRDELEENVQNVASPEKGYDALLLRAAFYLLWQSGLRSGEVELLRFSDFYISQSDQAKRLLIRDSKWRKGRAVYLTDVTLEALKAYLAIRGIAKGSDFVFVRNGIPLKKDFLSRRLKVVGRQVDVSVSPHRLRHTYATQLLNVGCRVTSIQKLLGHTHLNTTMTYARAFDQTVMLDYFQAVDTMETQPDGAWFGLSETLVKESGQLKRL